MSDIHLGYQLGPVSGSYHFNISQIYLFMILHAFSVVDSRELRPATRLPTVRRHLILIRHGQCDYRNPIDAERELTSLGRIQAKMTALRLAALKLPIDKWVFSTMQRAQETGNILLSQQRTRTMCKVEDCPLIVEGIPCEPSPYEYWNEDEYVGLQLYIIVQVRFSDWWLWL